MGEWLVKHDGTCSRCGVVLRKGMPAVWERATRTMRCIECPATGTIETGVAGASARARYERLSDRRDAAITDRWGTGLAARLVRTFSEEPQSTRAWAIGAAGEEALAASLAEVPGLIVLNDRRVPGTRGNIDHIVVAPAGIFVVDAKANQGIVTIRDRGWLLKHDYRLTVNRRDCSAMADHMAWQMDAVLAALEEADRPPVTPVLCFTKAQWPVFGAPDEFHGVRLASPRTLKRLVTSIGVLTPNAIEIVARGLAAALGPK